MQSTHYNNKLLLKLDIYEQHSLYEVHSLKNTVICELYRLNNMADMQQQNNNGLQ